MKHLTRHALLLITFFLLPVWAQAQDTPVLPTDPGADFLYLTAPNGGELIRISEVFTITWTSSATLAGTIELDLMDSGGTVVQSSIADAETNDGTYSWDTSGLTADDYRVRISATSDTGVSDVSDAAFTLAVPLLTVTAPNGGEDIGLGSTFSITWTSSNLNGDTVELDLMDSGGAVVTSIADAETDDGAFSWSAIGLAEGTYRVRVSATTNGNFTDQSDALFTLTSFTPVLPANPGADFLYLTAPNGGENIDIGDSFDITWMSSATLSGNVGLDLLDSGGTFVSTIDADEANDGTFSWDTSGLTAGDYRVRIHALSNATIADTSDAAFTLAASITVTAPNGGETIGIGDSFDITWGSAGLGGDTVELDLMDSDGTVVQSAIASAETDDGTFSWDTSGLSAGDYRVRVSATSDAGVSDVSDASFTLAVPSVTVTAPNGGETINIGETFSITWGSAALGGDTVELDLMDSGGTVVQSEIANAETDDGTFIWSTLGLLPGSYRVRVQATSDAGISDVSDASFTLTARTFTPIATRKISVDNAFSNVRGAFAADVDGDGDLDLVGAARISDTIAWFDNTAGDGSAWTETPIDAAFDGAWGVHAADIDGDGDVDVLGAATVDDDIAWWSNTSGDGTTWTKTTIDGAFDEANAVRAADVDGDGDLDVVGAAGSADEIAWWENTAGDGSAWTKTTVDAAFDEPRWVHTADVDGDGDLDVLGAAATDDQIAWWSNTAGDGSAWTQTTIDAAFDGAYNVHTADVDGDGDLDVLGAAINSNTIAWWANTAGDGSAWTQTTIDAAFVGARSVYASDIDGDGDLDVLGAAQTDDAITWWENTEGDGTAWTEHPVDTGFDTAAVVHAADLDGDGDPDFVGAAFNANEIAWWQNARKGRQTNVGTQTTIQASFNGAQGLAAADIDADGDLDVLAAAASADDVAWFENTAGDGSAWTQTTIDAAFTAARNVEAADIDGDGDLDVVSAASTGDDVAWWENDGTPGGANWTETTIDASFDGAYDVDVADIDGDGDLDVIAVAITADDVAWWKNTAGDGSAWTETTIDGSFNGARNLDVADLDGDGDLDVAATASTGDEVAWFENTAGDGSAWTKNAVATAFDNAWSIQLGDMDGDGDLDIVASANADSGTGNKVVWFANDGAGGTWTATTMATPIRPLGVALADFDQDGDLDLMTTSQTDDDVFWYENTAGDGSAWTQHVIDANYDNAFHVLAADLDGDGDVDFAGTAFSGNEVSWWANTSLVRTTGLVIDGTEGTANNTGWRLLAPPCAAQLRSDIIGISITGDDEIKRFDESAGSGAAQWLDTPAATALPQGSGFAAYLFDDATQEVGAAFSVVFPDCTPTLADVVVATLDANEEWFLAGNPFMNDYDLSSLSIADFQATVKLWNPTAGTYLDVTQGAGTDDVVRVGQGFFIQRTTVGVGATSLTYDDAGKTSGGAFVGKGGGTEGPYGYLGLTLTVEDDAGTPLAYDEAASLLVATGAGVGWDRHASSKLRPLTEQYATVALLAERAGEDEALSRFSLPRTLTQPVEIPLQFDAVGVAGTATLAWPRLDDLPPDWRLELVDAATGAVINLRQTPDHRFALTETAGKTDAEVAVLHTLALGASAPSSLSLVITPGVATGLENVGPPTQYALDGSYPNPFAARTTIRYQLARREAARLAVYDLLGREVAVLASGAHAAGWHAVQWDGRAASGRPVAAGTYLYRLETPSHTQTRLLVRVR